MSSEKYIYLKVERYMQQYLTHHFGDPIVLPKDSPEQRIIRTLLVKPPHWIDTDAPPEDYTSGDVFYVRLEIPYSKEKDPRVYNYLVEAAKDILVERLDLIFMNNMWTELLELSVIKELELTKIIYAWCESHGIPNIEDDKNAEVIRQKYYRLRKKYRSENDVKLS
ncbi:hypothetical protein [Dysgonomonas sp. HGC4]|uniref:hypothetical protein n=1 Tax=Dysgonomonas sp. HGC4 TaxID=1658009 RepID=UPI00068367CE|nr:hypothetical protein [Dysgonomonas sp. HGC4]MBD8349365.1 hypothetical protein [Dysgonomonas sp. HGC4]